MRIVKSGNIVQVYDNSIEISETLSACTYSISFSQNKGFYLEKEDFDISTDKKIYGEHPAKAEKVLKRFKSINRNCGVLLSGSKGIGKSTTAKLIAQKALENGYPVLIVDEYIPGISDFIQSIQQEVVILFDEYDKTFSSNDRNNINDPNTEMLGLFDGVSPGKKLFIITCNSTSYISEFLIARPGRILYHFKFSAPSRAEILEYLEDNLNEESMKYKKDILNFALRTSLNYDCLEAIVFELNCGETFLSAISDLNIIETKEEKYTLYLEVEGEDESLTDIAWLSPLSGNQLFTTFYYNDISFVCSFTPLDAKFNDRENTFTIPEEKLTFDISNCDSNDQQKLKERFGNDFEKIHNLIFKKQPTNTIDFTRLV